MILTVEEIMLRTEQLCSEKFNSFSGLNNPDDCKAFLEKQAELMTDMGNMYKSLSDHYNRVWTLMNERAVFEANSREAE